MSDRAAAERKALADEARETHDELLALGRRITVMENHVEMIGVSLKQLQDLFATRTVERDSGPTP